MLPGGFPFFSDSLYVKLVCVIIQYTAESTYGFIFSLSLFGFKMDLKCTYASVAKTNFPGKHAHGPPHPPRRNA